MKEIGTNAEKLPWPQDIGGITARLKREGCRSIGRINGNDDHFDTVMKVLRVLAEHAKIKLIAQKKHNVDKKDHSLAQRAASAATKAGDRALKIRNIEADMKHLQKQHDELSVQSKVQPVAIHKVKTLPPKGPEAPMPPNVQPKTTKPKQSEQAKSAGLGLPKAVS